MKHNSEVVPSSQQISEAETVIHHDDQTQIAMTDTQQQEAQSAVQVYYKNTFY